MIATSIREKVILSHMPQVRLLARRLHRRCPQVELEDLISVGTIGLIQAVDRFNPSGHLKLKTLAEHRVNGVLLEFSPHIDPPPRGVRRSRKRRGPMIDALSAGGEVAGHERIAHALGVSLRKYVTLSRMIAASEPISIHESAIASELTR